MLVLSRKAGEEIVIDGNIRIVVNRISGNRVSLAIEAPNDVRVVRGEICEFHDDIAMALEKPEPLVLDRAG